MKYNINEIFYSIQGEGYNCGMAAIFIRFSGCNRSCNFCDTDFHKKMELTIDELINEIKKYPSKNIIFTGGEPLLQLDESLITELHKLNYYICVETNGSLDTSLNIDFLTISPKKDFINLKCDELKVVLIDEITDETLEWFEAFSTAKYFYLQPCSMLNIDECIEKIKKNNKWRLSIQTQKILKIR